MTKPSPPSVLKFIVVLLPIEHLLLAVGLLAAYMQIGDQGYLKEALVASVFLFLFGTLRGAYTLKLFAVAGEEVDKMRKTIKRLAQGADPWATQLRLMLISGQDTPSIPKVTKGTALYGALIAEEAGETLVATARALEEVAGRNTNIYEVAKQLAHLGNSMQGHAKEMRTTIAAVPPMDWLIARQMSFEAARELLDGYTDLHVVTAGGTIASGLPGALAYAEVGNSNLSKANPHSGLIEKDNSGKWIKGENYVEPNMHNVIGQFYSYPDTNGINS